MYVRLLNQLTVLYLSQIEPESSPVAGPSRPKRCATLSARFQTDSEDDIPHVPLLNLKDSLFIVSKRQLLHTFAVSP